MRYADMKGLVAVRTLYISDRDWYCDQSPTCIFTTIETCDVRMENLGDYLDQNCKPQS